MSDEKPSSMTGQDGMTDRLGLTIDITTKEGDWAQIGDLTTLVQQVLQAAYQAEYPECPEGEVSVLLTSDAEVQALNAEYRQKHKATNILSFPAIDPDELDHSFNLAMAGGPPVHLGDLALAYGVLTSEATNQDKSIHDHLSHLLVHGILHLLGYDHIDDEEAEIMEGFEREILEKMGIADPYHDELTEKTGHND